MDRGGAPELSLVDVIDALQCFLAKHKGHVATFSPKTIAELLELPRNGYYYGLVNRYLKELSERGFIEVYTNHRRKVKYIITRNSPLWPKISFWPPYSFLL